MKTKLVEWVIYNARWLLLGGLAFYLASYHLGGFGTATGSMAMWLGGCGATFRQWRHEAGLWMLSGLCLAISLPIFAGLAYDSIWDIAQARAPSLPACDIWGANFFLAVQVLVLATVTRTNWSLAKNPATPEL
ncbi:MAG: hypothetical protein ACHRXM_12980 [Isosphaerales bacterium]